jgi:hypothetical protein
MILIGLGAPPSCNPLGLRFPLFDFLNRVETWSSFNNAISYSLRSHGGALDSETKV